MKPVCAVFLLSLSLSAMCFGLMEARRPLVSTAGHSSITVPRHTEREMLTLAGLLADNHII